MGFKEEILMKVYRSITLSQYLYNAPLLGSASTQVSNCQNKNIPEQLLTKALRIKRDGYINKHINPRKAETTTPEYITVIQDLKQQAKKA